MTVATAPNPFPAPSGRSASDQFATLTRSQWANYISTFVPYENKLIDFATSTTAVGDEMAAASQNVNTAFDRQGAATTERLQGLGLSLNADEQKAATRSLGLARSLADVNAQNSARDATMQRQRSILGLPAPGIAGG
jgi:hypothetical protein